MSDIILKVEGLTKKYTIGENRERYVALRDVLARGARNIGSSVLDIGRRLFPLTQNLLADPPTSDFRPLSSQDFWALRDVSFEVKRGEVLGIIGRNGAGKSTLLKILSRITEPTAGRVRIRGRVASLLEVGTGFHPELTGRENIFLNGAILGMTRREIRRKFDEIVAFAEVEKFIDTPVKHYSSGMYVRLAFAVAAHLEPEILLVDEVLAVGDAAFQKKCLGKMSDVAKEGRTVLFVSHNMTAITTLCVRTVLLAEGRIAVDGISTHVVSGYLSMVSESGGERIWDDLHNSPGSDRARLRAVRLISNDKVTSEVDIDKDVQVEVEFWNLQPGSTRVCANIYLLDSTGGTVLSTAGIPGANLLTDEWWDKPHPPGLFRTTCTIPGNFLNEGRYYITVYILTLDPITVEADAQQVLSFTVFDTGEMRKGGNYGTWHGVVRVRLPWRTELIQPIPDGRSALQETAPLSIPAT